MLKFNCGQGSDICGMGADVHKISGIVSKLPRVHFDVYK